MISKKGKPVNDTPSNSPARITRTYTEFQINTCTIQTFWQEIIEFLSSLDDSEPILAAKIRKNLFAAANPRRTGDFDSQELLPESFLAISWSQFRSYLAEPLASGCTWQVPLLADPRNGGQPRSVAPPCGYSRERMTSTIEEETIELPGSAEAFRRDCEKRLLAP
jgi:hypothetical protein